MSKKPSVKQQFQQAHDLITKQKYKEARVLLQQIEHPKAQEWLAQLEDKKKQSTPSTLFSSQMLGFGVFATVLILGVILAFVYLPQLIYPTQLQLPDPYGIENIEVTDEEVLYLHIVSYCYQITGYGGSDLCLDWTDDIMQNQRAVTQECLRPYIEYQENCDFEAELAAAPTAEATDEYSLTDDDYIKMAECLTAVGVEDPL